jgi:hypothetical protein
MNPFKTRFSPLPSEVWTFYRMIKNPVDAEYFRSLHGKEIEVGEKACAWFAEHKADQSITEVSTPVPWHTRELEKITDYREAEQYRRTFERELAAEDVAQPH